MARMSASSTSTSRQRATKANRWADVPVEEDAADQQRDRSHSCSTVDSDSQYSVHRTPSQTSSFGGSDSTHADCTRVDSDSERSYHSDAPTQSCASGYGMNGHHQAMFQPVYQCPVQHYLAVPMQIVQAVPGTCQSWSSQDHWNNYAGWSAAQDAWPQQTAPNEFGEHVFGAATPTTAPLLLEDRIIDPRAAQELPAAKKSTRGGVHHNKKHDMPTVDEESWLTRTRKRQEALDIVHKSDAYITRKGSGRSINWEPDPHDRDISKRTWEIQLMKFRRSLGS